MTVKSKSVEFREAFNFRHFWHCVMSIAHHDGVKFMNLYKFCFLSETTLINLRFPLTPNFDVPNTPASLEMFHPHNGRIKLNQRFQTEVSYESIEISSHLKHSLKFLGTESHRLPHDEKESDGNRKNQEKMHQMDNPSIPCSLVRH